MTLVDIRALDDKLDSIQPPALRGGMGNMSENSFSRVLGDHTQGLGATNITLPST